MASPYVQAAGPDHLPIYLTNRCNLACDYCYVAVNQGPPAKLDFDGLKKALDDFFAAGVERPKITFLGGEPLLDFKFLQRIVDYIRRTQGDKPVLQTFTNGTTLDAAKLRYLNRVGVHVNISLDGKAETNDKHRKFVGDAGKSVLGEVLRRIEGVSKDHLGVSLVFTAETVATFLSNVDFFYRQGFRRITFTPELYEIWPDEKVAVLKKALEGLRLYYKKVLAAGRPFEIQILYSVLENMRANEKGEKWWHDCHNRTLGADGNYYACDKALSFPVGTTPQQVTGNLDTGVDFKKRDELYARAIGAIEAQDERAEWFCPMGPYFYSEIKGEDPAPRLESFHKVSGLFADQLLKLIEENKDHPDFQKLYYGAHVV